MIPHVTELRGPTDLATFRSWFNDLDVMRSLGVECVSLEPGRAVALLHVEDRHRNPNGSVNGGYLAAAVDVTAGAAVSSSGEPAAQSATADLSIHYLTGAGPGPLRVVAEVLRRGRRNCVPTVRVTDADGTLCAVATGTWVLVPGSARS